MLANVLPPASHNLLHGLTDEILGIHPGLRAASGLLARARAFQRHAAMGAAGAWTPSGESRNRCLVLWENQTSLAAVEALLVDRAQDANVLVPPFCKPQSQKLAHGETIQNKLAHSRNGSVGLGRQ